MSVLEDTVGLWVAGGFAATVVLAVRGLSHTVWAQHHPGGSRSSAAPDRAAARNLPGSSSPR